MVGCCQKIDLIKETFDKYYEGDKKYDEEYTLKEIEKIVYDAMDFKLDIDI